MKIASQASWFAGQQARFKCLKLRQKQQISNELPVIRVQRASIRKMKLPLLYRVKYLLLSRGTNTSYLHTGTFQEAIAPVLVMAQCFAIMPVRGVLSKSAEDLNFSWRNYRTYYALFAIICFGFCSSVIIAYAAHNNITFDSIDIIIFYTSIFFIAITFFNLARKWPALCVQWQAVERQLPALKTEQQLGALGRHIKAIALVVSMCSLIEHLLSVLSIVYFVNACPVIPNHPIQSFLYTNFAFLFYFIDYANVAGIIGKLLNVLSTFAWNFNDIFVMAVSVALAARFRQLNAHMQRAARHPTSAKFWMQCRVNYRNLCKLCAAVDDAISSITLLCFTNNLFFICGKIMKSIQKKPSITHLVYFWFSLIYLLGRTLCLSLYSASINDESKRPLVIFRGISRAHWCPELRRFSEEVHADTVALSGMKFFNLTRGVVLSVAGSIVTYELVLLQYNKQYKVNDCYES